MFVLAIRTDLNVMTSRDRDAPGVIPTSGVPASLTIKSGLTVTPITPTLGPGAATHAEEQLHNGLSMQHSVVTQDVAVLQSLALTGEALLTSTHTFLVLDHLLDVVHALRRLHMESERGSAKGLDENMKACRGRVIDMWHCCRRVGVLSSLV